MTLKNLKTLIASNSGKLTFQDIYFQHSDDQDVDIYWDRGLLAYIPKTVDDEKEVADIISVINDNSFQSIPAQIQLAQYLGVDVPTFKPITVEKVVEQQNVEHLKLTDMIEAYEKILIGRDISASK